MRTLSYTLQRLILIALTAFIVSSAVFIGVHQLPGNAFLTEHQPNPQAERLLLEHFHLNLPWPQQYVIWVGGVFHGNLGESLAQPGVLITPLLLGEARTSLTLGLFALLFTIVFGISLGTIAALKQNTWIDYLASGTAILGYSVPSFITAALIVLLTVKGFYTWSGGSFYENLGWGKPEQVAAPAIALGFLPMGLVARLTRASVLDVVRQDFVRTAWAKGLGPRIVITRHVMRNAMIPVITILGPVATSVVTGSIVIEFIFGIPGLGKEFIDSILSRDYNVTIGVFTFYAMIVGLVNLGVDLIYPMLDPRIKI